MIVGTAGHIDHGKTTLVRALTGVDTDRLPEEKKRGISIELGYAYLDAGAGAGRIGFIDVPGHERLVATMLAGATGIDYALLLVAADDGPMPQTREHLALLSLLGIGRGAVVVTKADRVDAARLAEVEAEMRALVASTALEGAPIVAVSATTGAGIEPLRNLLVDAAQADALAASEPDAPVGFRLAVDRVFTLAGVGTVVTGTAHAGRVAVGDLLRIAPSQSSELVRVRSIHAQDTAVAEAGAGQRVALGLVGIERSGIARGQWLVSPAVALTTTRLDARIAVWRGEAKPLRSGAVVHVHLGSADVLASVAVLDRDEPGATPSRSSPADAIAPGGSGRIQLVLRAPLAAWHGDRLVLRDAAATRAVAGGIVLDPEASARYRRTPERLALLDAAGLESRSHEAGDEARTRRFGARLAAAPAGIDVAAMARAEGLAAVDIAWPAGTLTAIQGDERWALAAVHAAAWRDRLVAALDDFHRQRPDEPGPDAARLRRLVAPRMAVPLWRALLGDAVAARAVGVRAAHHFLPQHEARLSVLEQRLVEKAWPRLLEGGFDPPWVRTLAADLREPEAVVRAALLRMAQRGELHQVVKDLYYPPATLARAAGLVRTIAARDGVLGAAAFRDASGLGRKRAIQIVEYFDRVGLLRRVGDEHRLRTDCELFDGAAARS